MANTTEEMTAAQAADILRQHNAWRRGDDESIEMVSPSQIGRAIDVAIAALAQPSQEPVYYSITVNGHHCGNFWPIQEEAEAAAKRLNASYPQDSRAVVPLFTHPQPSAPVAQTTGDHDFPVDLVERLRKACTRMGIATSPSLEECSLKLDALLYALCRAIESHYERISTAPQVEAKEGWRLVPVDATPEMRAAGYQKLTQRIECDDNDLGPAYRAMIDAAPSSQKEGEQEDDDEPCPGCFQRGCNGECSGDGMMGD